MLENGEALEIVDGLAGFQRAEQLGLDGGLPAGLQRPGVKAQDADPIANAGLPEAFQRIDGTVMVIEGRQAVVRLGRQLRLTPGVAVPGP